MKQLLILLWLPLGSFAQHKLSGSIIDAERNQVPFADIVIMGRDSVAYKKNQSDDLGRFEINLETGNYILKVSSIGFGDYFQDLAISNSLELKPIILESSSRTLESVEIISKRPIVKRLVDRMEFSVENSSLSFNNAWEILSKTPGVTASGNGNLSVRGSQSILVTINDKKIYMTGDELKQFLESTSGEEVKSVEVITNPPAKYEAQGGIVINIKLKKVLSLGYKGSANSAYVQSMYAKGVVSTGHFYKSKKLSLTGRYSLGSGVYVNESENTSRYFNEDGTLASEWKSDMRRKDKSLQQHSYRLEATYEIDSSNVFTAGTTGFHGPQQRGEYAFPTFIYNGNGLLDSLYVTSNKRKDPVRNVAYNFLYEHLFSEKSKISVASDFTDYFNDDKQDIGTDFYLPDGLDYRNTRFTSQNNQGIKLFAAQVDYSNESSGNFETGLRFGKVDADNILTFKDEIDGELIQNENRSNHFIYSETNLAGYAGYGKEFGKWSVKAGIRGEFTALKGNSVTTSEINEQRYFKIFPTFYALYKASDSQEIGFSYGKRISRPQYSVLNPFRTYFNNYSYFTGDPKLLPTIIHNLNLLYTLKSKYNFDLFYRYEKNPSMEISYQDYETNNLVYQFTNIEKDYAFGLEFNTNLTLFDWWEAGIQAGMSYVEDSFQGVDGKFYQNGRPTYNASANNRFALNKTKDFNGEVNFYYNSSSVQGTFVFTSTTNLSLALRKKVLKSKGEAYVVFSDIYRGQKQTTATEYGNQYNSFRSYGDTQSFRLGFRYNFGNQKLEGKSKEKQTEEQQRL
jgi:hypothetical protein